jgi:flagellin
MAITINSNPVASAAAMHLARNNTMLEKSLSRLSSGTKLVDSSADPGGLAVSMKLGAAINRQTAAITNVQNAISFVQLQDGDIKAAASIVDRMAELRSMYDDVTKSDIDKQNYDTEFQSLRVQLYQSSQAKFNGVSLFSAATWGSGTVAGKDVIEVLTSERGSAGSKVSLAKIQLLSAVTIRDADGAAGNMSVGNYATKGEQAYSAARSLAAADKGTANNVSLGSFSVDSFILALQNVATLRAENGATSSRLQFASEQLESAKVNMEAARSRIVDTDVAEESTRFARYSILVQAGAAMLSQANNTQASVMQMLLL